MNAGFSSVTELHSSTGERILVDSEGNRVIAATRRPDGSLRKELRIRPGYLREEEKERYATRGTEFRKRVEELAHRPVGYEIADSTAGNAPAISKSKKKKKKPATTAPASFQLPPAEVEIFAPPAPLSKVVLNKNTDTGKPATEGNAVQDLPLANVSCGSEQKAPGDSTAYREDDRKNPESNKREGALSAAAREKRLGVAKSTLRQIVDIEKKLVLGQPVTPAQREKVTRKAALEKEVALLSQEAQKL